MSVDQTDVIDFVGRSKATGDLVLTVSDHLDWEDPLEHLYVLQEKLNHYVGFVQSGQLVGNYADAAGKKVHIQVFFRCPPPAGAARQFLATARSTMESHGLTFSFHILEERISQS
jgi:hypothetical protein